MEDCKPVITPMQTSYVMQVVGHVARFQAAPKESHVLAVKRIFRYLKGT
jgi:hypothetical protein